MSNISRLSNFSAAGAGGGAVDPEVGSRTTISGDTISLAHVIPYPNSNYFIVPAITDNKSINLYLFSVDPTTLATTYKDGYSIRTAYDNRFGLGCGINTYNNNRIVVASLDNGGYFHYNGFEIDTVNGAIQGIGSYSFSDWSSGTWKPLQDANFFKYSDGGYFAQFFCDSAGEIRVKYVQHTSNNNYTIYSISGTNRYYDRSEPFTVVQHPNELNAFFIGGVASNGSNDGQVRAVYSTNTNNWAGVDVYNSPWSNNTGNKYMGMGLDTVNPVGYASGNNQYIHITKGWYNSTPAYGTGLRVFETNNNASTYGYYTQQIFGDALNTASTHITTREATSGGMCGLSGNFVGQSGIYSGGSSYAMDLNQWYWNHTVGWEEVVNIFYDSGPNNSAYRALGETVGYNPYSNVNLTVYRDIYQSQWYARAFRGKHLA